MTESQQKQAARQFIADWTSRGDEKQDTQTFWLNLLQNVFGVEEPHKFISFEMPVKLSHTSFIDGYIPATRVLIEQKSQDINLKKGYKQSDGSLLSPFQQARRYAGYLPHDQNPRWIVVCNFQEFHIHDMNFPNGEPEVIRLTDLEKEVYRLKFLVDTGSAHIKKEMEVSLQAGTLVGKLYDALLKQYKDPTDPETLKSLNALCVRLVFCLYAEDAGIFGQHGMFHDYLRRFEARDVRKALMDLFEILDTKEEDRDPYLDEDLLAFPYVNGGLFADKSVVIPRLDGDIVDLILEKASADFDWSVISPTIFGAVFESTLNPETRRSGGMHYTSIENIHKVIDPLFLDDLRAELDQIKAIPVDKTREKQLKAYQTKLAGLTFLDPACGSGNFLTETYLSLRRLENEVIDALQYGQITLGQVTDPIQVSIGQFYGIEINDFAVTVAKTALWIAESQMMQETEKLVRHDLDFLPLRSYANIEEGNALRMDWETVVPKEKLDYIMGNPPFVGYSLQTKEQKADILSIYVDEKGKPYKTAGKIDYVSGWYFKAAQYMNGTEVRTAFVSTNSITQGEQVAGVWKPLYDRFGIHIDFAHRTFRWDSEASLKAHVHCVIVGFSVAESDKPRKIYTGERYQVAENINAYLLDAEMIFVEARTKAICNVPVLQNGGKPTEGGFLILSEEEKDELLQAEPQAIEFIRPYMMGKDFISRRPRYCLWMVGASPAAIKQCPKVRKRIEQVREYRIASPKAATQKKAETPMLFDEVRECKTEYVAIPKVSSENRRYIPMDYLPAEIIPGDKLFMLQEASLYHFGVLMSNVHMAWMRAVCGRLKSDYSYSNTIVYNNFPWPTPTEAQKDKIEQTAQSILDARALYPDASLADLYDEATMPVELRKAHQANDRAVMQAYGFDIKTTTEAICVAELMKMYQEITEEK
ncbi:MAG: class I SAM-dependent DNA methyltransferase [Ruminiclostridium sp.]|nr:class I SAM-dependent DNA methyltransferase [Ruminiclostridium sp.]